MPTMKPTARGQYSLAEMEVELVRRHQRRVAECRAALSAATMRLARAEADLERAVREMGQRQRPHSRGRVTRGSVHGNATRSDTTLREAILRIVVASPNPVRTADIKRIAESMGYSVASVSTLIKFHAQKGSIRQARYGWWTARSDRRTRESQGSRPQHRLK